MEILERALKMLAEHPLCDHCFGRQFALLGHGMENKDRGEAIKGLLAMKELPLLFSEDENSLALMKTVVADSLSPGARDNLINMERPLRSTKKCFLCEGAFDSISQLADKAAKKLEQVESTSFLVGIELPLEVAEREDEFKARFNVIYGESMKNQLSRNIGKQLHQITSREVSFTKPDVVVLINPFTKRTVLQINPLHVAGRYRKLVRGIPQSRWLCRECGGKGCEACNDTGKRYLESVEELIGIPMLKIAEGSEIAFHGAGREDVDVRMLGSGRPFVLEIKEPKKRFFDLGKLGQTINKLGRGKVEVLNLRFANKDTVRRFKKEEGARKIYRATIEFDRDVSDEDLKRIDSMLSNAIIHQQTPQRVLHRRPNLRREKYIYEAKTRKLSPNRAEMQVHCQGGLYIKELVTGDDNRTEPSVTSIVGTNVKPLKLDVVRVITGEEI